MQDTAIDNGKGSYELLTEGGILHEIAEQIIHVFGIRTIEQAVGHVVVAERAVAIKKHETELTLIASASISFHIIDICHPVAITQITFQCHIVDILALMLVSLPPGEYPTLTWVVYTLLPGSPFV